MVWELGVCTTLLLLLISWISGFVVGVILDALCFSQTCRKLLLFLLQSAMNVLAPSVPAPLAAGAVQLRSRLGEYRQP